MKKIIIIPARLKSVRLPDKLLIDIEGVSVLKRTYLQANKSKKADEIYIATDSNDIYNHCKEFTKNVLMTSPKHNSGTDRVAELANKIANKNDIILNLQGDEPFINPIIIDKLFDVFRDEEVYMATAVTKYNTVDEIFDPNSVNVVLDKNNYALYFSRSNIPFKRDAKNKNEYLKFTFKHIGIYAFKNYFLQKFSNLDPAFLEKIEKLEQLRALENGYKIKVIKVKYNSISVDTEDDLQKAIEYAIKFETKSSC